MPLPTAAQAQLDAHRAAEAGTSPAALPEAPNVTQLPTPSERPNGDAVTISRDEFNELQANAGRVKAAEGKAEMAQMEIETLQTRLTALEQASKGNGQGGERAPAAASSADDWHPSEVQFSDQENTDYGESRAFIEKVVRSVLNEELPKAIKALDGKIGKVSESLESTARRTEQVEGADFNNQVKADLKVDGIDFDTVVNHQHWKAFCESEDANTGYTYGSIIMGGLQSRNKKVVERVFRDFAAKYGVGKRQGSTGYEGAIPSGGSRMPENDGGDKRLPFSERKAAHKKFVNGEISQAEYQRIADDYSKAEREDRIDYDA